MSKSVSSSLVYIGRRTFICPRHVKFVKIVHIRSTKLPVPGRQGDYINHYAIKINCGSDQFKVDREFLCETTAHQWVSEYFGVTHTRDTFEKTLID